MVMTKIIYANNVNLLVKLVLDQELISALHAYNNIFMIQIYVSLVMKIALPVMEFFLQLALVVNLVLKKMEIVVYLVVMVSIMIQLQANVKLVILFVRLAMDPVSRIVQVVCPENILKILNVIFAHLIVPTAQTKIFVQVVLTGITY